MKQTNPIRETFHHACQVKHFSFGVHSCTFSQFLSCQNMSHTDTQTHTNPIVGRKKKKKKETPWKWFWCPRFENLWKGVLCRSIVGRTEADLQVSGADALKCVSCLCQETERRIIRGETLLTESKSDVGGWGCRGGSEWTGQRRRVFSPQTHLWDHFHPHNSLLIWSIAP